MDVTRFTIPVTVSESAFTLAFLDDAEVYSGVVPLGSENGLVTFAATPALLAFIKRDQEQFPDDVVLEPEQLAASVEVVEAVRLALASAGRGDYGQVLPTLKSVLPEGEEAAKAYLRARLEPSPLLTWLEQLVENEYAAGRKAGVA